MLLTQRQAGVSRSSPTRADGSRRRSSRSTTSWRSRRTRSDRCASSRSIRRDARSTRRECEPERRPRKRDALYWLSKRRESGWRSDDGTDVLLSFVDLSGRTAHPDSGRGDGARSRASTATCRAGCRSAIRERRLRARGRRAGARDHGARQADARRCSRRSGSAQTWRLMSQLSLNYLSLVDVGRGGAARDAAAATTSRDSAEPRASRSRASLACAARRRSRASSTEHGLTLRARPPRRAWSSTRSSSPAAASYLFATVLEHFFGLYASINSFSMLAARSRQRKRSGTRMAAERGLEAAAVTARDVERRDRSRSSMRAPAARRCSPTGRSTSSRRCSCWSGCSPERAPVGGFADPRRGSRALRRRRRASRFRRARSRRSRTARTTRRRGWR